MDKQCNNKTLCGLLTVIFSNLVQTEGHSFGAMNFGAATT